MILGFLSVLAGSSILGFLVVALIFIVIMISEYRDNLIRSVMDYLNNIWIGMSPFGQHNGEHKEEFTNFESDPMFDPYANNDTSKLSPGNAFSQSNEKLLSDYIPIQSNTEAENAWSRIPSETCLKHDDGEKLKPLANYYQRTNNYKRTNPDDCSAPFHEMLGTFYKPTLGVGQTAPSGQPFPGSVVSCNGSKLEVVGNSSIFTNSISE